MKLLRARCWLTLLACAGLTWSLSIVHAQDAKEAEKPPEAATPADKKETEPAKEPAPATDVAAEPAKDVEPAKEAESAKDATAEAPVDKPADAAVENAPNPDIPQYFNAPNNLTTKPDPIGASSGYWTTPALGPVGDGPPKDQTPVQLYDKIVHNLFSINMMWTLLTGFLVMFMQTGFSMVEGGLSRAKNACHTWSMNFMIYPLGGLGFWAYGFAIGWGNWFNGPVPEGWWSLLGPGLAVLDSGYSIQGAEGVTYGLFGMKGFFLHGMEDVSVMAIFFFMMVFMDTTATIPTGAMAERWNWNNFCLYGLWVALPYCLYAHWVWGGGWLAQAGKNWHLGHGAIDFAGSGVVHAMGGVLSLAGCIVIGPRIGKYLNGKPQALPGHNIPAVVIGTFILAFGWFGFNPGSTLAGTDLRISIVTVNTMLASFTGALGAMCYLKFLGLKPDPSMMCNGMLSGLVAITAPCAFVDCNGAAAIGAVAGVLCVVSVFFWDRVGVDDVVGAISVHGVNGVWGVISVGLFATGKYGNGLNGVDRFAQLSEAEKDAWTKKVGVAYDGVRGLFYGDASQLWAQLLDAGVVIVFGFVAGYLWFKFSNLIVPIRVSKEVELEGLDGPQLGALAYPDFEMKGGRLDA